MLKRIKNFLAVEVATTSIAIWWGIILILPYDTFSEAVAYGAMSTLAPEFVWALVLLLIGFLQLYGIVRDHYSFKRFTLLFATGVWIFIATMFALGSPFNTATGTYVIIGCLTGWLYTKVGEQKHGR